jgi:hypothetical protein
VLDEDAVLLNLANAYFKLRILLKRWSIMPGLGSEARCEFAIFSLSAIGVLQQQNKLQEALNNFKLALKADPRQ